METRLNYSMTTFFQDESRGLIINDNGVTFGHKFFPKNKILEWQWKPGSISLFREANAVKGPLSIIIRTFNPLDFFRARVVIDEFAVTEVVGNFQGHVNELKWEQKNLRGVCWKREIEAAENEKSAVKFKEYFDQEHRRYKDIKKALDLMLASKDA